jgi:hypothetical protein
MALRLWTVEATDKIKMVSEREGRGNLRLDFGSCLTEKMAPARG